MTFTYNIAATSIRSRLMQLRQVINLLTEQKMYRKTREAKMHYFILKSSHKQEK